MILPLSHVWMALHSSPVRRGSKQTNHELSFPGYKRVKIQAEYAVNNTDAYLILSYTHAVYEFADDVRDFIMPRGFSVGAEQTGPGSVYFYFRLPPNSRKIENMRKGDTLTIIIE